MGRRLRGRRKTQRGRGAGPVSACPLPGTPEDSINFTSEIARCPALQPITSFSSLSGLSNVVLPSGVSAGASKANVIGNNSSVIEILVQLLCRAREPDPDRRKLLFQALCKVIKQWNSTLYIPLHSFSELRGFQTGLLEKFEFLFNEVQSQIHSDLTMPSLQLSPSGSPLTQLALTDAYQHQFLDDRYSREFTEISNIGKGGFGTVVKARSKLDGCDYAIKIIIMDKKDNQTNQKTLREVQALAKLDHPNIVRYHTTWLQLYRVPPQHWPQDHGPRRFTKPVEKVRMNNFFPTSKVKIQELSSSPDPEETEESSGGIVFMDASKSKSALAKKVNVCDTISETGESSFDSRTSSSEEKNGKIIQKGPLLSKDQLKLKIGPLCNSSESAFSLLVNSGHSRSFLTTQSSYSKITLDREDSVLRENKVYTSPPSSLMLYHRKRPREAQMTLFIQMGLCGENLAEWISKRNAQEPSGSWLDSVDPKLCLEIFRQLILAVQYIHSKNIIHRDLKPPNIFFIEEGKRIQLGDFGLARFMPDVSPGADGSSNTLTCFTPLTNDTSNTGGVGTPIYAPPEVKFGGVYGSKSDVYNLGIILLELFHPFRTGSERVKVINDLKDKRSLDPDLKHQWPEMASWILKLTDPDQAKRPTAAELLVLMSSRESLKERYTNHFGLGKHIDNDHILQESEGVRHHLQINENETQNSCDSLNSRFNDLKILEAEELGSCSHLPGSESAIPIDLQTFKMILKENKDKDKEIRELREENRKLLEMVAQFREQINQSVS